MRVEGEHRRRKREIVGGLGQACEHRLMAAMHAVEVADGQRDVVVAGLGKSANDVHAAVAGVESGK